MLLEITRNQVLQRIDNYPCHPDFLIACSQLFGCLYTFLLSTFFQTNGANSNQIWYKSPLVFVVGVFKFVEMEWNTLSKGEIMAKEKIQKESFCRPSCSRQISIKLGENNS
jgi:hypothetical protein